MRLDSSAFRAAGIALATAAALACPAAAATASVRADVTGDGRPDRVVAGASTVAVVTASRRLTLRLRSDDGSAPRFDGLLRVRGVRGAFLLVRVADRGGAVGDALYHVVGRGIVRFRVPNGRLNGLAFGASGGGFADFDCGADPRTVVQITAEAVGSVWRETIVTFELRRRGFALRDVAHRRVAPAQASRRRCALVRLP